MTTPSTPLVMPAPELLEAFRDTLAKLYPDADAGQRRQMALLALGVRPLKPLSDGLGHYVDFTDPRELDPTWPGFASWADASARRPIPTL